MPISRLYEITDLLAQAALGKIKSDLVIKNGTLVNVYTGEILEKINIAVKGDRIVHVGKKIDHTIGENTLVIDAEGKYLAPGLIDGHIHIESSMLVPSEFAKVVLPRGTTSVFADPHEIANVLGVKGIDYMIQDSESLPLKVFITAPSCVPASTEEFETSGAEIGPKEIERLLRNERIVALGEVMNYPGVIYGDEKMHGEIKTALKAGKVVEGHYPSGELDEKLSAYIAAGVSSCHESVRKEDALEKARKGMHVMIREASGWRDLSEVIRIVTEDKIDIAQISLVSDDRHLLDLIEEGHMDYIVRRAIEEGVDPVKAIQMATINTARHFKLDHEIGGIAPGRIADIVIIENIEKIDIAKVIANGELVAENGKLVKKLPEPKTPENVKKTVKINKEIKPEDFNITAPQGPGEYEANVIKVKEGTIISKKVKIKIKTVDGEIKSDPRIDLSKVAVIERHKGTGRTGIGLLTGLSIKIGAVAMTIAHDSHNMIVAGVDEKDMAKAANKLKQTQGGITIYANGEELATVELPVAGIMSDENYETLANKLKRLEDAWERITGKKAKSPYMTLSMVALPVIPEIRITDRGLVDTVEFKKIPLLTKL